MTIAELKEKNITELTKIARTLDLPGASGMRKQDLIRSEEHTSELQSP